MSMSERRWGRSRTAGVEDEDEQRRLRFFHLLGLAAGGVIGSGWVLGPASAYRIAGSAAWESWLIGGLLMLVVAGVMVELGIAAPKTGGLIFLPLQSSGALVATVVAAGLWIFYAINSASEAVAMTYGVHSMFPGIAVDSGDSLTGAGWILALIFIAVVCTVNLVASRLFFRMNSVLTVVKIAVPVLAVAVLVSGFGYQGAQVTPAGHGSHAALAAVVDGGVIYAYVGFQGPLDLAGNIKRRGIGEAARVRLAVFGTLIGSMVLYIAIQLALSGTWRPADPGSPAGQVSQSDQMLHFTSLGGSGFSWLFKIDVLISPMGSGLVFAHALTREVAALSRAHLTHRGLQAARKATLRRRYDVYWLVLGVDFVVGAIVLAVVQGHWVTLTEISGVLSLIVYAVPGVVLVSARGHLPACSRARHRVRWAASGASFVLIALVLYAAGWPALWRGMAALVLGCLLLLGLPSLWRWRPSLRRFYDAKEHVALFRQVRTVPAAQAGVCLLGYLAVLTLLTGVLRSVRHGEWQWSAGIPVVALVASAAFLLLVRFSEHHMIDVPPVLPLPGAASGPTPPPDTPGPTPRPTIAENG